jgi:hypothetical protein
MKITEDETGTIVDIVNFAEKVGLIESVSQINEIRRTRNTITHDYALNEIKDVVSSLRLQSSALLAAVETATQYHIGRI